MGGALAVIAMLQAGETRGQGANPADAQSGPSTNKPPVEAAHMRSWEMPPVVVVGKREPALREEDLVGAYAQPRWTATRRFPTTRVYIVPEGKMELEYWLRTTFKKDGTTAYRSLYEAEIGLPHRFQFDIYMRTDQSSDTGEIYNSEQLELRYALADWGVIPGNPTLYFEWIRHDRRDEPDQIEPKLLLGGDLCPSWHWGLNFVGELQLDGDLEHEYSLRSGLSRSVIDAKLAVGAECQASFTDTKADRGAFETSVLLGPSFQYRPLPQMTINAAPLVGLTADSPKAQVWFNCGWEF
jgi:hypothetical protein